MDKESVLRVLEAAKARCAAAVLEGKLTVAEYEDATGLSGDSLREQVILEVCTEAKAVGAALKTHGKDALQRMEERLEAAGVEPEERNRLAEELAEEDDGVIAYAWRERQKQEGEPG